MNGKQEKIFKCWCTKKIDYKQEENMVKKLI